jgi:outer membrane autotransporter protein
VNPDPDPVNPDPGAPLDPLPPPKPPGTHDPVYRPEVGAYLDNRDRAMAMLTEHSLHDRQSHRISDPADATRTGWARFDGSVSRNDIGHGLKVRDHEERLHAGLDLLRTESKDGELSVGGMILAGHSRGDVRSAGPDAKRRTEVNAGGLYATWHANRADQMQGFYADTWFLAGRIKNRVHGDNLPQEEQKARGLAASLELGYGFNVKETETARYFLEPEAQVILGRYRAGSHTEENGTVVSHQSDRSLTTRLGVRFTGEQKKTEDKAFYRSFAVLNWWHGDSSSTMRFDADHVKGELPTDRLELKVGLEGQVSKKLSLWGSLGAQSDFDGYRQGEVQIGLRYRW